MLAEGFQIMLIGMGTVVLFLVLLVFVMLGIGRVVKAIDILNPIEDTASSQPSTTTSHAGDTSLIAAAIAIAKLKK
ncbi:MAG: OadG family transporter subunit [Treponemataceae bacterium]